MTRVWSGKLVHVELCTTSGGRGAIATTSKTTQRKFCWIVSCTLLPDNYKENRKANWAGRFTSGLLLALGNDGKSELPDMCSVRITSVICQWLVTWKSLWGWSGNGAGSDGIQLIHLLSLLQLRLWCVVISPSGRYMQIFTTSWLPLLCVCAQVVHTKESGEKSKEERESWDPFKGLWCCPLCWVHAEEAEDAKYAGVSAKRGDCATKVQRSDPMKLRKGLHTFEAEHVPPDPGAKLDSSSRAQDNLGSKKAFSE